MKPNMHAFKAYYFFIYAAMAFLAPFLTLYYESLGLNGKEIGLLAAMPSIITFLSAPTFGVITDTTQQHKKILGFSILMVITGILWMSRARGLTGLIPAVIVYAFFFAPALPIIDRSVLELLGDQRDQYGKQRLWGAIGWGILAPVSGLLVDRGGLLWAFYGSAVLYAGLFVILQLTPIQPVGIRMRLRQGLGQLFSRWQVSMFFGVILVGGTGLAMIHHYLFLYLSHLGASPTLMGSALTVATLSELAVMYYSDRLLKMWKARGLIAFGLVMIAVRMLGYSWSTSPEIAILFQLLHGPTFAALWMAGVAYVADIAPPGLGNTAQGLFTGVVMGLGSAMGAFIGGFMYQSVGFSRMYLVAGIAVFVAFMVFWWGCRSEC
jgi:PPP family 3-phenylpropionic acid transporter